MSTKTVIVYSTPTCVYCKQAKEYFKKNNVAFSEINVAEDDEARERMIQKSGQFGVPVIEVGDEVFVGFDQKGLAQALGLK